MDERRITRRDILKGALGATAFGLAGTGLRPAGGARRPLKTGLIGCGGRGTGAAQNHLQAAQNLDLDVRLWAMADVFESHLEGSANRLKKRKGFEVDGSRRFIGLDAYKKLLDSGVDIVILATPPGWRPEHFEACVAAGKQVFSEKPVATFAEDCRRFMKAGEASVAKGLRVVAGTQRRHERPYVETIKRIHDGAIGQIRAMRAYWCGGPVIKGRDRQPGWTDMEYQLQAWYSFVWICGDHIVEQHVHNLDVCNWAIGNKHPVRAFGSGGAAWRPREPIYGNIYDHFTTDFTYDNGVHMISMCRQYRRCANNVSEAIVGSEGESNGRSLWTASGERFNGPRGENPYVQEHMDLLKAIVEGKPLNEAQHVSESTMTAIMGRIACYTGKAVTWEQMMRIKDSQVPRPATWDVEIPIPPLPVPGQYRIEGV